MVMGDVSLTDIIFLTTTYFKTEKKYKALDIIMKVWDTWNGHQLSAYNMRASVVK